MFRSASSGLERFLAMPKKLRLPISGPILRHAADEFPKQITGHHLSQGFRAMLLSKKLKPGQPGTKRLVAQYGQTLLSVRYRYDAKQCKRFKTVELIIEESFWQPPVKPISDDQIVGLRIGVKEVELQRKVKSAGGKWNYNQRVWEIRYDQVVKLELTDRIAQEIVSNNGNQANVSVIRK